MICRLFPDAALDFRFPSQLAEQTADHVARDALGNTAGVQGIAGEVCGLTELVATGESEGVGNSEDEGDNCGHVRVS